MAVSPTDRARYDEQISRTREEAEERETETTRRKNSEIKNAERRHQAEIKRLTEDYQTRMAELQRRSRETLNDRDFEYKKEVDGLKNMYKDQIRRKSIEGQTEKKVLTETYKGELQKQKEVSAGQRLNLEQKQEAEAMAREQRIAEIAQQSKAKMNEAIADNGQKLREAHEQDRELLSKDKRDSLSRKELELNEIKKSYTAQLNAEKRQRLNNDKAWQTKYYDTIKNYEDENGNNLSNAGRLVQAENERLRDRYEKTLEKRSEQLSSGSEKFKDNINERINTQVKSRDSQIHNLKKKLTQQEVNNNRLRSIERQNLQDSYEERMGHVENARDEAVEQSMDLVHKRVNSIKDLGEKTAREANKNYRSQMNLINTRNRADRKVLVDQQEMRLDQVQNAAESRIEKLQKINNQNSGVMARTYDEAVEVLKEGYSEKVAEQRDKHISEQTRLGQILTKRVRNMEVNYHDRLDQLKGDFETRLTQMKEDHRKQLRSIENNYKNLMSDKEKGHKLEKESMEQKYESKITAIEEQHQRDKEVSQRQHEKDMKDLAQRLSSSYSRKA